MSKVGLKALSESLGLSEGTVSRALNGYPDISAGTRQRVKDAADRIGYRPNSTARRLAKGDAECIGYVLPWREGHLSDPFLAELLDGLSDAISVRHWDLTVSSPSSSEDELALIERLAATGRVNGLVISRTLVRDPRVDRLRRLKIPFVTHGRTAQSRDHAWFDIDSRAAFRAAVDHLVNLGHRRIALIGGAADYFFAVERREGYLDGLRAHGLALDPSLQVSADMTDADGYAAMRGLLARSQAPTAVICVSDRVALGAMKAIHRSGWLPGREISIIGYDGVPLGEYSHPALTTMEQPLRDAGKRIGEMLLALIDGGKPEQHQELWRATLKRRETDGPPGSRP